MKSIVCLPSFIQFGSTIVWVPMVCGIPERQLQNHMYDRNLYFHPVSIKWVAIYPSGTFWTKHLQNQTSLQHTLTDFVILVEKVLFGRELLSNISRRLAVIHNNTYYTFAIAWHGNNNPLCTFYPLKLKYAIYVIFKALRAKPKIIPNHRLFFTEWNSIFGSCWKHET